MVSSLETGKESWWRLLGKLINYISGSFSSLALIAVCSGWHDWQIQVSQGPGMNSGCTHSPVCSFWELWEGHSTITYTQGLCSHCEPRGGIFPWWRIKAGWVYPPLTDGETNDISGGFGVLLVPCTAPPGKRSWAASSWTASASATSRNRTVSVSILLHCVFLHQGWKGLSLICFSL